MPMPEFPDEIFVVDEDGDTVIVDDLDTLSSGEQVATYKRVSVGTVEVSRKLVTNEG